MDEQAKEQTGQTEPVLNADVRAKIQSVRDEAAVLLYAAFSALQEVAKTPGQLDDEARQRAEKEAAEAKYLTELDAQKQPGPCNGNAVQTPATQTEAPQLNEPKQEQVRQGQPDQAPEPAAEKASTSNDLNTQPA